LKENKEVVELREAASMLPPPFGVPVGT